MAALIAATALLALACGGHDDGGPAAEPTEITAFQLRVGDCFDDPDTVGGGTPYRIDSLLTVPCSEAHDNEVFARFDVPAGDDTPYPGEDAVVEWGADGCLSAFDDYVGTSYLRSRLDIAPLYPTRESWERGNDREIVCLLYDLNLEKLTYSMRGSEE